VTTPAPVGEGIVVGLMSGTSLDGITAAVVRFRDAPAPDPLDAPAAPRGAALRMELLGWLTRAYAPEQRDRLARAMTGASPNEYCALHADVGEWLAAAAVAAIAEAGVSRTGIRAVASHGHTIWHIPGRATWQIGDPAVIAERTGHVVIADFRAGDIAAGGQGAPLVPIADAMLFASPVAWRALQNLGGIGNVTIVPPGGDLSGVRAFDTGPGVAVIDGVVRMLAPELPYDTDGRLALAGTAIAPVVERLLAEPYFSAPPPKSTGRELFSTAYIERLVDLCHSERGRRAGGATTEDIVATAVALTARSIADAFARFIPEPVSELLLSGGGAKNPALFAAIAAAVRARPGSDAIDVRPFDAVYFDGEAKEAVAFALLGWLHLTGRPGNVPAATGARGARVLGSRTG
jgi:anhydro-N-acetylmuramic acid kinase